MKLTSYLREVGFRVPSQRSHQKEGTTWLEDTVILVQNRPLVTHKAQVLFGQIDLELD